jgi:hypothetical protein
MADPTEFYPVIAQVAAVFAGFGSLASGLGQRRGGDDARIDAYRLGLMLFASLSATMFGLLPATLTALLLDQTLALRVSAAAALAALLIKAPLSTKQVLQLRKASGFNFGAGLANSLCVLTAIAGFLISAAAIVPDRLAAFYLVGLMGLLGSSVVMFSRVIRSILRPHSTDGQGEL